MPPKSSQVILTTKKNAVTKARVMHRYIFCHIAFFYGIVNNRDTNHELEKKQKIKINLLKMTWSFLWRLGMCKKRALNYHENNNLNAREYIGKGFHESLHYKLEFRKPVYCRLRPP